MSPLPGVPKPSTISGFTSAETKEESCVHSTVPQPDGFGTVTACEAVIEAGRGIAHEFPNLDRRERLRLVAVFRAQLIPPRKAGRKGSQIITAAHADWKAGLRGPALYEKPIQGFQRMSQWRRRGKMQALIDAIRSRERRAKKRAATALDSSRQQIPTGDLT